MRRDPLGSSRGHERYEQGAEPVPDQPRPGQAGDRPGHRELHRRYGHTPELAAAAEQGSLIGKLSSGQLISRIILLRRAAA